MLQPIVSSLRTRNRGRMGLRPFHAELSPGLPEIGVDRVTLKVSGRWQGRATQTEALSLFDAYREYIATDDDRFERPGSRGKRTFLTMRRTFPSTISKATITLVRDAATSDSNLFVDLDVNPTRTLEHLLLQHGRRSDFRDLIEDMLPADFFHRHPNPRTAAGGADNFLSDLPLARLRIADDVFGAFLPIYVRKLQAWLTDVLAWSEFNPMIVGENGATRVITSNFEVRLDWYRTTLYLTEVYFERNHDRAHEAIQRLARTALAAQNSVHVRAYQLEADSGPEHAAPRFPDGVARRGRELSVSGPLTEDRRYTIYAKNEDRLRLELKYKELPGAREHPIGVTPEASLLHRLEAARRSSLTDLRWANIGAMLEPVPASGVACIVDLVAAIGEAIPNDQSALRISILRELLTDGGIAEDGSRIGRDLLDRLNRRGVIEYRPVRIRERRGTPRRYLLAIKYRAARDALLDAGDQPLDVTE